MANLQELISQRAALERQIAEAQKASRTDALAQIRALMQDNGLTPTDLVESAPARKKGVAATGDKKPVAAKYKDEAGNTWSGRGLKPNWLKAAIDSGKTLEDLAV